MAATTALMTTINATMTTAPPPELTMGIAAAIGVVAFLVLMIGGFCSLLQCACRCPAWCESTQWCCCCVTALQGCRICSLGFQRTFCYRMTAYGCLLCYSKCCKRSKRYYDKMMVRSRRMLDNLESDMEEEINHMNRPLSASDEEEEGGEDEVTLIIDEL